MREVSKCLSTHVSDEEYWKFKINAARSGKNMSEVLSKLVLDFNENEDMAAMLGTRKVEEADKKAMKEAKATTRQMEYIQLLCDIVGEKLPQKSMTVSEASDFIQALKAKAKAEEAE